MSTTNQNGLHHVDLEVTGQERPLLKLLLENVRMNDDVRRIHVEIESESPLFDEDSSAFSAAVEARDAEDQLEPHSFDEEEENREDGDGDEVLDLTHDDDLDEEPEAPEGLNFAIRRDGIERKIYDAAKPAEEYIDALDSEDIPEPNPVDFVNWTIGLESQAWRILGTLYRAQGRFQPKQLYELLKGSDWEIKEASLSSNLHNLKDAGLIDRMKEEGSWPQYQLTQLGRDYVYARNMSEGYALVTADKITGKHPTDSSMNAKV